MNNELVEMVLEDLIETCRNSVVSTKVWKRYINSFKKLNVSTENLISFLSGKSIEKEVKDEVEFLLLGLA